MAREEQHDSTKPGASESGLRAPMRPPAIVLSIFAAIAASLPIMLLPVMVAPAWAECAVERDVLDDALQQAPSCAEAYRLFEACELGAGGDVPLGAIVQEKCEAGFLARLDGTRKADYRRRLAICDRKYAKQSGSMYRSFEVFCRASVARDFSKKYSK